VSKEQRLWRGTLRPALADIRDLKYERVELRTGASGMPDVMYTLGGTGWIENKYCPTTDKIALTGWTPAQRRWAKDHIEAGGKVLLFVGTLDGNYFIDPMGVIEEDYIKPSHKAVLARFCGKIDRAKLVEVLRVSPEEEI